MKSAQSMVRHSILMSSDPPAAQMPRSMDPRLNPGASVWSRRIAELLDTCIRIPGTNTKIGLDPIIGLIPGVGDAISTFMGSIILAEALQRGVPGLLLMRIGGNMLLNAAVGAIPVVGDLFSAWFKSNSKNHALLNAFLQGNPNPAASPQSKWVLLGFFLFVLVLIAFVALSFYLLAWLWRAASHG